jgi:hypothetical protein
VSALSLVCVALVAAWLALVVLAQVLTPEQSPLSMGMSGLATGRHGWAMKAAFLARGLTAFALAAALPGALPSGWRVVAGAVLLVAWGAGSALLAVYDTDMPCTAPTRHGRANTLIALVAYLAVAGAVIVLTPALRAAAPGGAGWAWPLTVAALVFLVLQFAAFGKQAQQAAVSPCAPPTGFGAWAGLLQRVFIGLIMLWTALAAAGL